MQAMRKLTVYGVLLLIGTMLIRQTTYAQQGSSIVAKAILDGGLNQLKVDSTRTVEDTAFFNPGNLGILDTAYKVQNLVTLKINEATPLYLRTAFTVKVFLWIIYSNGAATDSILKDFEINYDSATTYNARNSFVFYGGRRVTVRVDSIYSSVTSWDPSAVLLVENQLTCSPEFILDCSNSVTDITVSASEDPDADELPVSWTTVVGADQYDLEWTYIDDSALNQKKYGNDPENPDPAKIFFHNATRVTTSGTSYNIPLIYDNNGHLFVRVRAVQRKPRNGVMAAIWSSEATPSVMGSYSYEGHERNLNWQSNISFAEEGKRKVVIQYFDGSLRSRQTVTKDNTTNKTIVAETYYDYQGRPAIQVMPAPSLSNVIQYTAAFNVSINGAEYTQSNYDTLPNPGLYCTTSADSMSVLSGASQYYSPNNPNKMIGMNQFIPDAKRYPFTETEYTQDNTGRISRQSGVGPDHQLGTGHETKYFYGTPDQKELNALFGTEVGDKSHYFKNMVRDANGQYSVSYVDMRGRTIATALAGNAPEGIAALPSNNSVMVTESLADSGSVFFQDLSIIHQKSMLVPVAGNYNFKYSLTPEALTIPNCDSIDICYTCLYDLEITITDNCNNQNMPGDSAFKTIIRNFSFGEIAASCPPGSDPLSVQFDLLLQEGSYQVTKKLTVNKDAYFYYRDSIYLPNNTCVSMEDFINEQKEIIANLNTSCIPSCDSCRSSLGTLDEFRDDFAAQTGISPSDTASLRNEILTAYNKALASCDVLCNDSASDDVDIRLAMLQDMTPPYGQYADTTKKDMFSIFFEPINNDAAEPVYQLNGVQYKDYNGNADSVYNLEAELMVKPNTLSPAQFIQNFRSSWAEALLPYHPEYCKLKRMEENRASYQWMRRMEAVDNFRDARELGYLNPTGNNEFPYPIVTANIDPFASPEKVTIEKKLRKYLEDGKWWTPDLPHSMWGMATMMARCPTGAKSCVDSFKVAANVFDTTTMCDGDLDMAWRYFRQLYIQEKQNILNSLINNTGACVTPSPYYEKVPTYDELYVAKRTPQFNNNLNTSVDRNGLNYVNQGNGSQAADEAQVKLDSFYTANARAMAQQWALQLSPCAYDPAHLRDTILVRLAQLARLASDVDHPFGASTLPAGVTYTPAGTSYVFRSFEDIINAYNEEHDIDDALNCNAELITAPLPYGNQPVYDEKPIFTKPGECECKLINDLYNSYQLSTQGDATFAHYLQRTQNIIMSNADLTTLRDMCNGTNANGPGTAECVWLPQPIYLPASMQCNAGTVCAPCTLIDSLYLQYQETYPGNLPDTAEDDDTTQVKKNLLFKNYMNNRLGFGLQTYEYLQFMANCDSSEILDTVDCVDRPVSNVYLFTGTARLNDIQPASNNGYILAGATSGSGAGGEDGIIIRTSSNGTVLWTRAYGGAGDDHFTRARHTSDNGYIAVGTTKSGRYAQGEMIIAKFSSSGATEWTKNIGFNTIYGETGYDIIQTSDGGFAALGIYDQHTGNGEFMIARLEHDGTLEWVRRFGTSRLQPDTCTPFTDSLTFNGVPAYGLVEREDTLVIAGTGYDSNLGERYFGVVYHVNKNDGELIRNWHYAEGLPAKSMWFRDIYATDDGYRILANTAQHYGTDSMQAAVVTISLTGEVVDYKRFNLPAGSTKITSSGMHPTDDGGYLVAQTGDNASNIFWQRVDAEGILQSETLTDIPGNQLVGRLSRNGVDFTAAGTNNGNKPLLVHLFPSDTTDCFDDTASVGMISPTLTKINWALEGSEYVTPLYTDTLLTNTVLSATDSNLVCVGGGTCYALYEGPRLCGKYALLPPLDLDSTTACSDSTFFAVSKGTEINKVYRDSLIGNFEKRYNEVCLQAYRYESFTVTHAKSEYHYTLYYYDQAGNLVRTVPPLGVNANHDSTWSAEVDSLRVIGGVQVPVHTMATNYRYNSLNQMVALHTPDVGLSNFWHDRLGRMVISQNANQADSAHYIYTRFDTIGRIVETGKLESLTIATDVISRNQESLKNWIDDAYETAEEITKTIYDEEYSPLQPVMFAQNLRNRIAWTALYNRAKDVENDSAATATYFSYDILGNVDTLVQDYRWGVMAENGNRFKKFVYDYDLVSGKVNKVAYQPGQHDAFYHLYHYDAQNRITRLETSTDNVNWDNDAFNSYYDHGPLSRLIIGEQQVQGINYAYTLQGWMKSINPAIHAEPGYTLQADGTNGSIVAKNAYDLLVNYYSTDFLAISGASAPQAGIGAVLDQHRPLFNGNISSTAVNINSLANPLLYNYQYDQLNRLVKMDAWRRTGNSWADISPIPDFQERVTYDPAGNILQYKRNGNNTFSSLPIAMDSLNYKYIAGTNKLDHVRDSVDSGNYDIDVDDQASSNYGYDANGHLIADAAEGIESITWTAYHKIRRVNKSNGVVISYTYDPSGNRISKTVKHADTTMTTWYVRDASGNTMNVYTKGDVAINNGDLSLTESHIYGISRIGVLESVLNVENLEQPNDTTLPILGTGYSIIHKRGYKSYELTSYTGNVLVTISDKKFGISTDNISVQYFIAHIKTAQDYFPGGMQLPGRSFLNGKAYRYGYQGSEKDNDLNKGTYTTLFREFDVRINRWWSPDPKKSASPWSSPYVINGNNPIILIDPLGDKEYESLKDLKKKTGSETLGAGDWLTSDRENNTETWKKANAHNLQQEKGQDEYTSIEQRAAFYKWFQGATKEKGFDTKWAGAAADVAFAVNEIANPTLGGWDMWFVAELFSYTDRAAEDFANTGNRMIFEDVFPKLKKLFNGPVLTGTDAYSWDAMALSEEQYLIQPLYETTKAIGTVTAGAKQRLTFSSTLASMKDIRIKPFPDGGNIVNPSERWAFGMQGMNRTVLPSQMPVPNASYTDGTMYHKFRGAYNTDHWHKFRLWKD